LAVLLFLAGLILRPFADHLLRPFVERLAKPDPVVWARAFDIHRIGNLLFAALMIPVTICALVWLFVLADPDEVARMGFVIKFVAWVDLFGMLFMLVVEIRAYREYLKTIRYVYGASRQRRASA
jgi:hypothetical protein